jgi:hypothetical protein
LKKGIEPSTDGKHRADQIIHPYPMIGSEVFVLGYPRGLVHTGVFPIWKRGSIASEPQASVSLDGHEYKEMFYVDALTKEGMSGSPVIALGKAGDQFCTDDGGQVSLPKDSTMFVGIYAGRQGITNAEYELSLGRVWKAHEAFKLLTSYKSGRRG